MLFFKKKNKDKKVQSEITRKQYNLTELEAKANNGEAMTSDEYDALQRERNKDIRNKVLRIFGVCAMLFVVVLAVGCFLYPYSIFNLFGHGDRFWDCWGHIQYHIDGNDIAIINNNIYGGADHYEVDVLANGRSWGWANVSDMMQVAFQGTSLKLNFIVLGSWSIVLVTTIGIVGTIIFAIYITAYNIKDLIQVIRHIGKKSAYIISDITVTAAESVEAGIKDKQGNKESEEAPKAPEVKPGEKDLFSDDEEARPVSDIEKKVEEALPKEAKSERRTEATSKLSSEDLDKLLSGETLDK